MCLFKHHIPLTIIDYNEVFWCISKVTILPFHHLQNKILKLNVGILKKKHAKLLEYLEVAAWITEFLENTEKGFPGSSTDKRTFLPMQERLETRVWPLSREEPLEKVMEAHSSILAWRKDPGGLQSMGLQGAGHGWSDFSQTKMRKLLNKNLWETFKVASCSRFTALDAF